MVSRVLDRLGGSVDNTGGKQSTPSMIAINFMPADLGDSSGLSPYLIVRNLCQSVAFLVSNSTILG
jgi:hypothetical protein